MPKLQKEERLHLRVTTHQKNIIVRAADLHGVTITDFILEAAYQAATSIISDQTIHKVPADKWAAIQNALDAPAEEISALTKMLKKYGQILSSKIGSANEANHSLSKEEKTKVRTSKKGKLRKNA